MRYYRFSQQRIAHKDEDRRGSNHHIDLLGSCVLGKATLQLFLLHCRLVIEVQCASSTDNSEPTLNSSCPMHCKR